MGQLVRYDMDLVRPGLPSDPARAARQPHGCRPPSQNQPSIKGHAFAAFRARRRRAGKSDRRSATALDRRRQHVGKDSSYPVRERVARRRHRSAQRCTGAVRPSSGSSADARWSSSGPRCRWSSSGSRRRSSLGGSPAGPVAGVPPRGGAGAPPRDLAGGRHLDGPAGLHGFDRGGSASLRGVEARAAAYAPTVTPAIVTPATAIAMAMPVATVIGRMRRLRLTPMADPTPPPTTAATTCLPTGDMAPGAFWSVMKTD